MVGSGLTTRLDVGRPAKLSPDVHVQNWTICAAYVVGGEQHGAHPADTGSFADIWWSRPSREIRRSLFLQANTDSLLARHIKNGLSPQWILAFHCSGFRFGSEVQQRYVRGKSRSRSTDSHTRKRSRHRTQLPRRKPGRVSCRQSRNHHTFHVCTWPGASSRSILCSVTPSRDSDALLETLIKGTEFTCSARPLSVY